MKKKVSKILLSMVAIATISNAEFLDEKEFKDFDKVGFFNKIGAEIKSIYDNGSVYIVNFKNGDGNNQIYVNREKNVLFSGVAVDMTNGKLIDAPVKNLDSIKGKQSFVYGVGEEEYYLFTDAQCPYCKQFLEYFPQIKDKVKINIFHYPLVSIHPQAKSIAKYQNSLRDSKKDVYEILKIDENDKGYQDRKYEQNKSFKLDDELEEQKKLADKIGVQGTPFLIDAKGNKINWMEMLRKYNVQID